MNTAKTLTTLSVEELGTGFADGRFTPCDLLDAVNRTIDQDNGSINAVIYEDRNQAWSEAEASSKRWRSRQPLSPLDGVPFTVKDNIDVAGWPTVWGSRSFLEYRAPADELPVARLRSAGAICIGKTNVPEFTLRGITDNPVFGVTRNPCDVTRTPGGSSGGAVAAVRAGFGPIALGTDGGGSIRRPAGLTGLIGLKPSLGRVPRCDGLPVILNYLEVIGPIGRTVGDVQAVMACMGKADVRDPYSDRYAGVPFAMERAAQPGKILYIKTFDDRPVDRKVRETLDKAVDDLRASGLQVDVMQSWEGAREFNDIAWPVVAGSGLVWLLDDYLDSREGVGEALLEMYERSKGLSAADYVRALQLIHELKVRVGRLLEQYPLIMTPTSATVAWPITEAYPEVIDGQQVGERGHAFFTGFVNACGLPAIAIPAPVVAGDLPVGIQLVAREGADGWLCACAETILASFGPR